MTGREAEAMSKQLKLTDREWRVFVFGQEFSIASTSSSIDRKKLVEGDGIYPYITRSDNWNGVDSFVCSQDGYKMDEGNVITIGLDTQTVFYQPSSFYTGQNIQVVRHPKLNRHNALFVIRAIKKLVQKFSWGSYGATLTRLKRSRIYLPITPDGTPDWAFMSAYMRQEEKVLMKEAISRLKRQLAKNHAEPVAFKGREWRAFFIEDLATIDNGIRRTKADMKAGETPFGNGERGHQFCLQQKRKPR